MSKPTWEMKPRALARVFGEHFGFAGRTGGWIYSPEGRPVAHGWDQFAQQLQRRGWIRVGSGVNWRAAGERPRL